MPNLWTAGYGGNLSGNTESQFVLKALQHSLSRHLTQCGHYSWKLLETPGIGIYSWKMRKLRKTPGKLLKKFLILK